MYYVLVGNMKSVNATFALCQREKERVVYFQKREREVLLSQSYVIYDLHKTKNVPLYCMQELLILEIFHNESALCYCPRNLCNDWVGFEYVRESIVKCDHMPNIISSVVLILFEFIWRKMCIINLVPSLVLQILSHIRENVN